MSAIHLWKQRNMANNFELNFFLKGRYLGSSCEIDFNYNFSSLKLY